MEAAAGVTEGGAPARVFEPGFAERRIGIFAETA